MEERDSLTIAYEEVKQSFLNDDYLYEVSVVQKRLGPTRVHFEKSWGIDAPGKFRKSYRICGVGKRLSG